MGCKPARAVYNPIIFPHSPLSGAGGAVKRGLKEIKSQTRTIIETINTLDSI